MEREYEYGHRNFDYKNLYQTRKYGRQNCDYKANSNDLKCAKNIVH